MIVFEIYIILPLFYSITSILFYVIFRNLQNVFDNIFNL